MIDNKQLVQYLGDLESDHVERTQSTNNTDKFSQAVCAFANDLPKHGQPGYLVIGVDGKGQPTGLRVTDQLLQNLGALRSEGNIQPLPVISVAKFSLDGGDVAVVEVQPSDLPPVRYKGRIWVRVGPRKAIASEQDERILTERRIASARSFDASPVGEASLDDLSVAQFAAYRQEVIDPDVIEANSRNPVLAEAMKALGYVNRFGYGIQRAKAAMAKNGNPPIRFEPDDRVFLAVLSRRQA